MCVPVYEREIQGEQLLNDLAKITLPESLANSLGSVFVSNMVSLDKSCWVLNVKMTSQKSSWIYFWAL